MNLWYDAKIQRGLAMEMAVQRRRKTSFRFISGAPARRASVPAKYYDAAYNLKI
jgi:hypothetical protein